MKFKVIKTYKYTEEVEVEADSKTEAEEIALETDGERINDDWLYDTNVIYMGE